MRLAHKIATANVPVLGPSARMEDAVGQIAIARSATVVVCDNVAGYLNDLHASGKDWKPPLDIPCFAPPFDRAAFEWRCGLSEFGASFSAACVVFASREITEMTPAWQAVVGCKARWQIALSLWVESNGRPVCTGITELWLVDERGFLVASIPCDTAVPLPAHAVVMSLAFMHCRDVERRDVTDTEGPTAKWLRRMKAPTLRYYTLDIDPMRKVLSSEGNVETNGIGKALHICRGHFRTYGEDSPGLFGRQHGTFWVPMHTRGKIENGAVVKDYNVKAPV